MNMVSSTWQVCGKYLQVPCMQIQGVGLNLLIWFIFVASHFVSQCLAASTGGNGCTQACYDSADYFCKLLYGSVFRCMQCRVVCSNPRDIDVCMENCQESQYLPKLPSSTTSAITRPKDSTLKPSTDFMNDVEEMATITTHWHTFQNWNSSVWTEIPPTEHDLGFLVGVTLITLFVLSGLLWLCCNLGKIPCLFILSAWKKIPSCKRKIASNSQDIPMKEIVVQNKGYSSEETEKLPTGQRQSDSPALTVPPSEISDQGDSVYQTSRPPAASTAVPPSDEAQKEIPVNLQANRAKTKGTATLDERPNPVFHPEDQSTLHSMGLTDDCLNDLPSKVEEGLQIYYNAYFDIPSQY